MIGGVTGFIICYAFFFVAIDKHLKGEYNKTKSLNIIKKRAYEEK